MKMIFEKLFVFFDEFDDLVVVKRVFWLLYGVGQSEEVFFVFKILNLIFFGLDFIKIEIMLVEYGQIYDVKYVVMYLGMDVNEMIYGSCGNDVIVVFDGDDMIYVGLGSDVVFGGVGINKFIDLVMERSVVDG